MTDSVGNVFWSIFFILTNNNILRLYNNHQTTISDSLNFQQRACCEDFNSDTRTCCCCCCYGRKDSVFSLINDNFLLKRSEVMFRAAASELTGIVSVSVAQGHSSGVEASPFDS